MGDTVTPKGTMACCAGLGENALHATMLCVMPCTTLRQLLGLPPKKRVALCCLEMIGGQLTSFFLVGQEAETLHWM